MNKELREIISSNTAALSASAQDFEAIYNISFSRPELIMAEDNNGFKIRRYTYGQVKARVEEAACAIYKAIGERHEWIGLDMENSVDWIAAFWGILKSGNRPYLINSRHTKELSESILKTLNITKIIADKEGSLNAQYFVFSLLPKGEECPAKFENEIALATSGTSLSETICFYRGSEVAAQIFNSEAIVKESRRMAMHYKGALKNLAFLPFYHVFGLFAVYFWFTFYQRTIVFLSELSADAILTTCRRHEVTHFFAVPMVWHMIESRVRKEAEKTGQTKKLQKGLKLCTALQNIAPFAATKLSKKIMSSVTDKLFGESIQFLISGGSFLRPSALELFNGIGYPMHNGYGMSEVGIASVELRVKPRDRNKNSIGRPFNSTQYRISEDGVLQVKGASLCYKRLHGGEEIITDGYIDTGDIVSCKDGYYYIEGRKGDTVIGESGENINPDMIEKAFSPSDAAAFSVLGLENEGQEQLCMVLQVSEYLPAARIEALYETLKECNATLPSSSQVRAFYLTRDSISPEGAIKVSRSYLKRAIERGEVKLGGFDELRAGNGEFDRESPLAKAVIKIVAETLMIDEKDIDCNANIMLDMGATSLQYFSILSALAKEFSLSAEENEKYAYTIKDFCSYIERHL